MLNNTITWNGVSSDTLGIRVERFPNLNRPQRKFEQVSVPGRNGDLFFFQDAWSNYEQSYEIFAGDGKLNDAPDAFNGIMPWLYPSEASPTIDDYINLTIGGYHRLIDSFEPDAIRLAVFSNSVEVANSWNRYGRSTLRFNCRPERFTADAFTAIDVDANTDTVSGDIATFEGDGSAVKDLTASIEPIQSGSGEPSPDNVRPISGWDAVKVYRTNKNMAVKGHSASSSNITITELSDGGLAIESNGANTSAASVYVTSYGMLKAGVTYHLSGLTQTGGSSSTFRMDIRRQGDTTPIVFWTSLDGLDYTPSVTANYRLNLRFAANYATPEPIIVYPMITIKHKHDYEEPVRTVTTVDLPQTVYGGTLDVTSGVLTVNRRFVELNGSESWETAGVGYRTRISTQKGVAYGKEIANWLMGAEDGHDPTSASTAVPNTFTAGSYVNINVQGISSITDVASLKTYLASNPLQVCYELATPTTVQLTPTEVTTLLGENNIWVDSGSVEVTFNKPFRNPTDRDAKPFIKIYGSGNGVLTINDSKVTITGMVDYLHIDCEQQNCYRQLAENRNNLITLSDGFPTLKAGDNTVTYSGGITKVEITPRWWRL